MSGPYAGKGKKADHSGPVLSQHIVPSSATIDKMPLPRGGGSMESWRQSRIDPLKGGVTLVEQRRTKGPRK